MRSTWNGCTRTRRWNASLPAFFTMYLLAAMRAASSASEEMFSFSQLHAQGQRQVTTTLVTPEEHAIWKRGRTAAAAARTPSPAPAAPDEVHAVRKVVHTGLLGPHVVDANLRVGDAAAEAGLGVGLALDLAVAPRRTCRVMREGGA